MAGPVLRKQWRDALGAEREVCGHARLAVVETTKCRLEIQFILEDHILERRLSIVVDLEDGIHRETCTIIRAAISHRRD